MQSFKFGDKNSIDDFGVFIAKTPTLPSPKRKVTMTAIGGRSGSLKYDEHAYEDVTIAVECGFVGDPSRADSIFNRIDEIKAWLYEVGETDLIFSFQNDKKYIAQVVNAIDFEVAMRKIGKFVIVFNCEPFRYAVNEPTHTITASNTTLLNNGTTACEPIITVFGNGDIALTIGEQTMQLSAVQSKIILDCRLLDAYNDSFQNLNSKVTGEYFKLPVGSNNVSWTGNVPQVTICQNRRWL
jgi:predicted phage tail component-like protein